MAILVLGGAGYIGSHAVNRLIEKGYEVVVVDNLSTGHLEAVSEQATFYKGDIRDQMFMDMVFTRETIDGVIHFAAFSIVPESVIDPLKYFDNNTTGLVSLLEVMNQHAVKKLIFSSTAAVYGEPKELPIKETAATVPTNPYGESKLAMEKIMKWTDQAYGIKFVALRYFNVAGASVDGTIGEDHQPETHLIPLVLEAASGKREQITIFGNDYDTDDGTCVRDYVHVVDLVDAHILAYEYLNDGNQSDVFNLGSANGFSNQEIVTVARNVTEKNITAEYGDRRPGDPSVLIADSSKARSVLGWQPQLTNIEEIIRTAWNWHVKHPNGYQN